MPINPQELPSDLHYLIPLADSHGNQARVNKFDASLGRRVGYYESLSPQVINELSDLYLAIVRNGHSDTISAWHERNWDKCSDTAWPIGGVLCLFQQLGDAGIAPFSDGVVQLLK